MTARVLVVDDVPSKRKPLQTRLSPEYFESMGRFIYRNQRAAIGLIRMLRDPRVGVVASSFRCQDFRLLCRKDRLQERLRNMANDGHAHAIPAHVIGVIVALGQTITIVQSH
jgi:hypothetical protein